MRQTIRGARFAHLVAGVAGLFPLLLGVPAHAAFHLARIDEVMVGYDGDTSVQFVEMRMLSPSQNFVDGVQLAVFDATGAYVGPVLTMDHDVDSGADRRWLIGTPAFAAASGVTPDFLLAPVLPSSGGGMICVGRPAPTQVTNPARYVDCISYGAYTGAANTHTSAPNPLIPNGFSLQRGATTDNSAVDFTCSDPADPEANNGATADLAATTPCSSGSTTTTTAGGATTTTASPAPLCGDGTDDGDVTATDALLALNTAVGTSSCAPCRCDVDALGGVTATDALRILNAAVGVPVTLSCPGC